MKLFVSSRLLGPLKIGEGLELVREIGYEGVEVWYESLVNMDQRQVEDLRGSELELTIHAASRDLNLTSTNTAARETAFNETLKSIDYASTVGARKLVVHPGRLSSSKDEPGGYFERQVACLREIAMYAADKGCRAVVENMEDTPYEIVVSPADVKNLVEEIGYDRMGVCLDFAHAATSNMKATFLDEKLKGYVDEIHVSNTKPCSTHVPMDEGESNLGSDEISFAKDFKGPIVIEGYNPAKSSEEMLQAGIEFFEKNLIA